MPHPLADHVELHPGLHRSDPEPVPQPLGSLMRTVRNLRPVHDLLDHPPAMSAGPLPKRLVPLAGVLPLEDFPDAKYVVDANVAIKWVLPEIHPRSEFLKEVPKLDDLLISEPVARFDPIS